MADAWHNSSSITSSTRHQVLLPIPIDQMQLAFDQTSS